MVHESAVAPQFDVSGRRIPPQGLDARVNPASDRYGLAQPATDHSVIHSRISEHIPGADGLSRDDFERQSRAALEALRAQEATCEVAKGTYVPFFLPRGFFADYGTALENVFLPAVGRSWKARYPKYNFTNELKGGLAGKVSAVPGSRHERLVQAMADRPLVGLYFPLALSGFSVDAAVRQMSDLPDGFALSGGYDTCAALVGSPELIMKEEGYPPQLDLSALDSVAPRYGYHFAAYGYNLTFNGRFHNGLASDYCSSGLTWISPKF
jgi:hypothetical protein